jgi:hypothetical protein
MVHKSSIVPALSKFIDEGVLSHYAPTSMKRILLAGAVSIYLKQGEKIIDTLTSNPIISTLGVVNNNGMVDIDTLKDVLKSQIQKAGFMRLTLPIVGNIDFTTEDVDLLHKLILETNVSMTSSVPQTSPPILSGGVY